jgi:hypothetical protein
MGLAWEKSVEGEEATNAQLVAKKSRTKDDDEDDYD